MHNHSQKRKFRGGTNRGRGSRGFANASGRGGKTSNTDLGKSRAKFGKGRGKPSGPNKKRKTRGGNAKRK